MPSYTEITETALVVKSDWSNKAVMQFHYFNPNGLYAWKMRIDEQIRKLVDQGKAESGAIFAYGSLNHYAADRIANLAMKKRVTWVESKVAIEVMMEAIMSAEKFIGRIMEETKKKAQAWADEFNKIHPIDFKVGDEVKFYEGDDLNVSYGTVTCVRANTCFVRVKGYEQNYTYQVKKSQLNYD